ncbi:MAG: energy-coupling factor transporter transmembrane protein EcfT [Burkholderiales bacterium]|nr:energy-coupling factor transporter transmembrane protein EcfT [Burkholderiales bacterium]
MLSNKFHPLNFIVLPLLGIIAIFCATHIIQYGLIFAIMLLNFSLLCKKPQFKIMLWFNLSLIPALLALFISSYFFASDNELSNYALSSQAQSKLWFSATLAMRLYLLSLVSVSFMLHLPQEQLILDLIQRKIVRVKIGYSFLAVFNAFAFMKQEFTRIQIAYKMRFRKKWLSPQILMPLLVAAARYAHHLSISMYTRGINQERSYHQPKINFTYYDLAIVLLNITILSAVIFAK